MRYAILVVALVGCISSDLPDSSFGMITGAPTVKFTHSTNGLTNYGGTGYYQWNIIMSTADGCDGDSVISFEINTPVVGSPNTFPTGEIPIRATDIPTVVPSALAKFDTATGVSGSITIKKVDGGRIDGSVDATLTTGEMIGSFVAYSCM